VCFIHLFHLFVVVDFILFCFVSLIVLVWLFLSFVFYSLFPSYKYLQLSHITISYIYLPFFFLSSSPPFPTLNPTIINFQSL
jgi:hypothetical protein